MAYFKRILELTNEEKREVSDMTGKIQLCVLEGDSLAMLAKQLNLHPRMIKHNMCETIYEFSHEVGLWNYVKWLMFRRK